MGTRPTGLRGVAYCYFATYLTNGKRQWSWGRFGVLAVLPGIVGVLLTLHLGSPRDDRLSLIVAVLAVMAAVLIGLLPLVHSIVGQASTDRKYVVGERHLAQQQLDRVQTLQDLHASISWSVMLLVVALGSCAVLALVPPVTEEQELIWQPYLVQPALVVLYSIMGSTALTFFDVARGVFEGMESHSEAIKTAIRNNIETKSSEETEE
jgi:4-amino-4-deoxy-L-arabinose transferase-like glycosyltransferase